MKRYFVYILCCADGTLYTGWTLDVEKRVSQHNRGTASKYTRTRLPVTIVYQEEVQSRSAALKREIAIKQMSRLEKQRLVDAA